MNQQLKHNFLDARIDHRSNAGRGIDDKPTIHEGVIARVLERKGILSDRCELNRQIKADNNLLRDLKAEVKHLEKMARGDSVSLAEALEKNKSMMIISRYQIIFNARQLSDMKQTLDETLPVLREYHNVLKKLKPLQKQMKALKQELDECSPIQFIRKKQIQNQMDALYQIVDSLHKSKIDILHSLGCKDNDAVKEVEKKMDSTRNTIGQVEHRQHVLAGQEEELLQKHMKLMAHVTQENAATVAVEQGTLRHMQQDISNSDDYNLGDVLLSYLDLRKVDREFWAHKAQIKALIKDLQAVHNAITSLQERKIDTVQALGAYLSRTGARMNELRKTVRGKEQRIRDIDALLAAEQTVKELQPIQDELNGIHWKGRREKYAVDYAGDLEKLKKTKRLLHKFGLTLPLDSKLFRIEKAHLEREIEVLRPEVDTVQTEMDELKTVRYWVRKVIPDVLPSHTENGNPSLRNTLEESQNTNELESLLERTARKIVVAQQDECCIICFVGYAFVYLSLRFLRYSTGEHPMFRRN